VSSVAPDGRRAAVLKGEEIWVVDLVRSVPMLFATNLASTPTTVWSPDGNRIAFGAKHEAREEIYIGGLDGRVDLVPTTDDPFKGVSDWSADGRSIVFWAQNAETGTDLWILPMEGDRKPVPYLHGVANESMGRISPDGRWLAYVSDETGQSEVYVQSFPEPGRKVRISADGGVFPVWVDGGRRLGYINTARRELVAVPVTEGEEFQPGPESKVADVSPDVTSGARTRMADGSALVSVATDRRPRDIRLILDWTALLGP
jgi:Tol biopolymer transport system component